MKWSICLLSKRERMSIRKTSKISCCLTRQWQSNWLRRMELFPPRRRRQLVAALHKLEVCSLSACRSVSVVSWAAQLKCCRFAKSIAFFLHSPSTPFNKLGAIDFASFCFNNNSNDAPPSSQNGRHQKCELNSLWHEKKSRSEKKERENCGRDPIEEQRAAQPTEKFT